MTQMAISRYHSHNTFSFESSYSYLEKQMHMYEIDTPVIVAIVVLSAILLCCIVLCCCACCI